MCMLPACRFLQRTNMAQDLVNGVLDLSRVCSLNDFQLVMGLCRGNLLFFLEFVYLCLFYPSLIFDMFLSLCVY